MNFNPRLSVRDDAGFDFTKIRYAYFNPRLSVRDDSAECNITT